MKNRLLSGLLVLSLLVAMSLSACTSGNTVSSSGETAASSDAGTSLDVKANPQKDSYKIAFISWSIGHSVPAAWDEGIKRQFAKFPNVKYTAFDGETKPETQIRIMQDLINQDYDAIMLQAGDAAALSSSVQEAEAAGIPVVCINLDVSVPHAGLVQMSTYEAGVLAAEGMAAQLGGKGKVVIIQGVIGASTQVLRESGFRDTMEKYPDIEILAAQPADWDKEKAITVMNSFLQSYPQIDGVFGINDSMAEGAALAAEAAGRLEGMYIWGDDGEKDALTMIENGQMAGTIYTDCFDQGATAAKLCMFLVTSGVHPEYITRTGIIDMEPIVVTKENVHTIPEDIRW